MAIYKVRLTVKDRYGNIKELDGGNIDIGLDEKDVENIADSVKDLLGLPDDQPVQKPSSGELPGGTGEPGNNDMPGNSDGTGDSEEPEHPTYVEEIINNIIENKLSMYTVTSTGTIEQTPYEDLLFDDVTYDNAPTGAGFYQKKNSSGKVVESGYQEIQIDCETTYYIVAFPKEIDYHTMITTKAYSNALNAWVEAENLALTADPAEVARICGDAGIDISNIDTAIYTVWAVEEAPTGSKLRFIIR